MEKKIIIGFILFFSFGVCLGQRPFFRYFNHKTGKHYYTTNFNEYGNGDGDWALEGPACRVFIKQARRDLVPLYRYVDDRTADHFYTVHPNMLGEGNAAYRLEGVACYIFQDHVYGTIPLFAYIKRKTGEHFYTVDKSELGRGFEGYELYNIEGYVFPAK
jgi:hypothetical protein